MDSGRRRVGGAQRHPIRIKLRNSILKGSFIQPRPKALLYPISQRLLIVASGPKVSHAQARSYMRCRPIHTVWGPGSLFLRSM